MKHKQTEGSLSTRPILFFFFFFFVLFNMILKMEQKEDVHFLNGNFFSPHTSNPANVLSEVSFYQKQIRASLLRNYKMNNSASHYNVSFLLLCYHENAVRNTHNFLFLSHSKRITKRKIHEFKLQYSQLKKHYIGHNLFPPLLGNKVPPLRALLLFKKRRII
jgi:hypothetical protein